jgi:hypothetical protein
MRFLIFLSFVFFASNGFCADFQIKSKIVSDIALENHDSQNSKNEFDDVRGRIRLFNNFIFSKNFSLNSQVFLNRFDSDAQKSRRQNASDGGGDRFFDNHGVILREFNLSYAGENYNLAAGKFNLNFGRAWNFTHGIWLRDLANQNYRLQEKLGIRGNFSAGNLQKTGKYNFGFTAFTGDSKNFDNAILNQRQSKTKNDVGFSRGLNSWLATMDVDFDFGKKEKLSYHFGYTNLDVSAKNSALARNEIANQKSWVAAINYQYPLQNLILDGLFEFVDVTNFSGNPEISEKYLTASLNLIFNENWSFLNGVSRRKNIENNSIAFEEEVFESSLQYSFLKNKFFDLLTIQAGFRNFENNSTASSETQKSLGLMLRYYKDF